MSETPTDSDLRAEAERLLAGRVNLITELGAASHDVTRSRQELRSAEKRESEAWSAATAGGWSKGELQRLGFTPPASRRGGRTGTRKAAAKNTPRPARPEGNETGTQS